MEAEMMKLAIELWNQAGLIGQILAVLLVLHPVASAVIAVVDPPKEVDKWYTMFYNKVLEPLALHVGKAKTKDESNSDS